MGKTRAAKVAEIWKHLLWLEKQASWPYLLGEQLTLADLTWFPTVIFMDYMLPRVFGWPELFNSEKLTPFPALAAWYSGLKKDPVFKSVYDDIWGYWVEMGDAGQLKPILEELSKDTSGLNFKMVYMSELNYQDPPPPGKKKWALHQSARQRGRGRHCSDASRDHA